MRKRLRKLIRRLVIWALSYEEQVTLVNWDINTGRHRFDVATVTGAKTGDDRKIVFDDPYARRFIINTIKTAKTNREL